VQPAFDAAEEVLLTLINAGAINEKLGRAALKVLDRNFDVIYQMLTGKVWTVPTEAAAPAADGAAPAEAKTEEAKPAEAEAVPEAGPDGDKDEDDEEDADDEDGDEDEDDEDDEEPEDAEDSK